jgi:hypothetical protein
MKLSPFLLFLIIIFTLAFAVIFGNWFHAEYATPASSYSQEGFLSYKSSVTTHGNLTIPYYSTTKKVHKLHDCFYYDFVNGAVIVLDGAQSLLGNGQPIPEDVTGASITKVSMYNRSGETRGEVNYTPDKLQSNLESELSKEKGLSNSYRCFNVIASIKSNVLVASQNDSANAASGGSAAPAPTTTQIEDKYQLIYIPWGKETYLHVIELKVGNRTTGQTDLVRRHKSTFAYDSTGQIIQTFNVADTATRGNVATYPDALPTSVFLTTNNVLSSHITTNDDVYSVVEKYAPMRQLYQLCNNVKYDKQSGDVISTLKDNASVYVYRRSKVNETSRFITPDKYDTTPSSDTGAVVVTKNLDTQNGFNVGVFNSVGPDSTKTSETILYTILYFSIGKRTILAALKATGTPENPEYAIHKIIRVDDTYNIDNGSNYSSGSSGSGSSSGDSSSGNNQDKKTDDNADSDSDKSLGLYEKAMRYWFIQNAGYDGSTISDYMLKTQVVPPVCPTCPSCPSSGVCTDCGGKGGSGTKNKKKVKHSDDEEEDEKKEKDRDGSDRETRRRKYDSDEGILRAAGRGTSNLLRDTGSGTTSLLRDTASGSVGLAKDTVGGAVGLAKETVGGAVGLAKETAGGVANAFGRLAPTRVSDVSLTSQSYYAQNAPQYGQRTMTTTAGSDPLSYFGALPAKGGDPIPVTADFSRFGR